MPRRLPDNIPVSALRSILSEHVSKFSDTLISIFQDLMAENYEASVETMTIGFNTIEDIDSSVPRYWRYLNGSDKLVTNKTSGNYAGDARDLSFVISDLPEVPDEAFYELDYGSNLADVLVSWTAECWWKAGGWFFKIPVDISVMHDAQLSKIPQLTKATNS